MDPDPQVEQHLTQWEPAVSVRCCWCFVSRVGNRLWGAQGPLEAACLLMGDLDGTDFRYTLGVPDWGFCEPQQCVYENFGGAIRLPTLQ